MVNTTSMSGSHVSIARNAADDESFVKAQDKAREWADRSIDLSQSGDIEQATQAERYATAWLSRMLDIESRTLAEPLSPARTKPLAARKKRQVTGSELSGNNATLRAWRRSCLLPNTPVSG
jgi:hypothetical protein